jgi:hypothetical protein
MPARFPASRAAIPVPRRVDGVEFEDRDAPRLTVMREALGRCDSDHLDIGVSRTAIMSSLSAADVVALYNSNTTGIRRQ